MLGIRNAVPASTRLSEWTESPSACSVPPPLNYGLYSPTTQPTSVCLSVLSQAGCSVHRPSVCPAGSAASRPCWPCALPASVCPPAARPAESTDGILSPHPSFCPPHPLPDPQQEPPSPSFSASPLLHQPQTRPVQPQAALGVCPSVRLHFWPQGSHQHGCSGRWGFCCSSAPGVVLGTWGSARGPCCHPSPLCPAASTGTKQLLGVCPGLSASTGHAALPQGAQSHAVPDPIAVELPPPGAWPSSSTAHLPQNLLLWEHQTPNPCIPGFAALGSSAK